MKRWYDVHHIGKFLDLFRDMPKRERDPIVSGILSILKNDGNHLIDSFVMDFPLEESRRRWYDNDPGLWMIFNGLEKADKAILDEVAVYIEESMKTKFQKSSVI